NVASRPCLTAAISCSYVRCVRRSITSGRVYAPPDWKKCTCASTRPGITQRPRPSTMRRPLASGTSARDPTALMRSPSTTTTVSGRAGSPVPSSTVAPTIAKPLGVRAGGATAAATSVPTRSAPATTAAARSGVRIDGHDAPGDGGGVGREQEDDDAGDGRGRGPGRAIGLGHGRAIARRVDGTGHHAVDADAVFLVLEGEHPRERHHARLGHGVGGGARASTLDHLRSHRDDGAVRLPQV